MTWGHALARSRFAKRMSTPAGRIARIVAGLALIAWGYSLVSSPAGVLLMVLGFAPLVAGLYDLCLLSALLGGPIRATVGAHDAEAGLS